MAPDAKLPGLELKLDGQALVEGAWGTAVPVDPGDHTLVASAPGHKTWQTTVSVSATHDDKTVDVPRLESDTKAVAVPAPSAAVPARNVSIRMRQRFRRIYDVMGRTAVASASCRGVFAAA